MKPGSTLNAKQINHGRSEIWIEANGTELTPRRNLATNEVNNVVRNHCSPEIFDIFYKQYHKVVGAIAQLDVPNLDEIAVELKLEPPPKTE